ncbi:MAG: hypothetical protein ACI3ZR_10400 [bacterium]
MKKIGVVLSAVLLVLLFSTAAFADYKNYLYNDVNYPLCDAHMGTAWYANLNSLQVKLYKPPVYKISVKVIEVDADAGYKVYENRWYHYKYNYSTQKMYVLQNGEWVYIPREGSWAECGVVQPVGELIFQEAYNIPFYK